MSGSFRQYEFPAAISSAQPAVSPGDYRAGESPIGRYRRLTSGTIAMTAPDERSFSISSALAATRPARKKSLSRRATGN